MPSSSGQRLGQGEVEGEIGDAAGQVLEVVLVEQLLQRAGAVPVADAALRVLGFEQVGESATRSGAMPAPPPR